MEKGPAVLSQPNAVITGISGQDGAYLAKNLLDKGYRVSGIVRPQSSLWRLSHLGIASQLQISTLDFTSSKDVSSYLENSRPQELYHLAAQSSVTQSFENPLISGEADALATLRLLEGIRKYSPQTRFFFASSSEIFGNQAAIPHTETTLVSPTSPYACAKLYGQHLTATYRQSYNIFGCSGILFNHESPLRGDGFVTRKIISGLVRLKVSGGPVLELGNLKSCRDWGYAKEYVEAFWLTLQSSEPGDYILATGQSHSVKQFCEFAASACGFRLVWEHQDDLILGRDESSGLPLVQSRSEQHRLHDVPCRVGDPTRARELLGWHAETNLEELIALMVDAEMRTSAVEKQ